ncbi:hypothetical protein PPYR_00922 [Photinus pyralis]|uniref:Peptidase M13 N-terminal domain-containing protein n=1 Tax=Photinus pyralis TaxID=7054 RepID=A0A5N4B2X0_PHOPY|nr:neprilysin-2-like isoform X1 [Photinus pyralis]KAB0803952.1 hypothetical protein PPYR_00922 [Photinus pyralis]
MPSFWVRSITCRDWWFDKSFLEKCLIIALVVCLLTILILSSVGKFNTCKHCPQIESVSMQSRMPCIVDEKGCQSSECLKEASRMLSYIDPNVNPCDQFYEFTCGNFLKTAGEEERMSLDEYKKAQLIDTYKERIKRDDHRMVQSAKKLFQACTNEVDIEQDGIKTLKEIINLVGGWPVLEGENWNEKNYDWKEATYKLRERGYEYSIFLELSLVLFPEKSDKFIYQVSSPDTFDYRYGLFELDKVELMADVVEFFNKGNRTAIKEEMEQVHLFWKTLRDKDHPFYMRTFKQYTIEEYSKFTGPFDWLDFINRIAGPTATITKTTYVLFPDPQNLTSWLDIIDKTSKRIQANYMMWKVVESSIPYLNRELRYGKGGLRRRETHEDFCLREAEKRFYPSPISVINDRRHITKEKRNIVIGLLESMRSEFIKIIQNTAWIPEDDRSNTTKRIADMKFLVAQPIEYFTDTILDDLDVDMVTVKNESFLELIAQANRNSHSWVYSQIKQPLAESYLWKLHIRYDNGQPGYSTLDNSLFIPGVAIQDLLFHERRPRYVNYGSMAALLGYHVSSVFGKFLTKPSESGGWQSKTKNEYSEREKCISESIIRYQKEVQTEDPLEDFIKKFVAVNVNRNVYYTKEQLGLQLAYSAYDSWVKNNGDELKLIGLDYTSRQLFWISAGITFCTSKVTRDVGKVKPEVVLMSIANNPNFALDFKCPEASHMNPANKCKIFS